MSYLWCLILCVFFLFFFLNAALQMFISCPTTSCLRMYTLQWSALRTCSPGRTRGRMVPVLWSTPRQASSTPTRCCPGPCCSPSALPTSSKTSCASKAHCRTFAVVFTAFQESTDDFRMDVYIQQCFECVNFMLQTPSETATIAGKWGCEHEDCCRGDHCSAVWAGQRHGRCKFKPCFF